MLTVLLLFLYETKTLSSIRSRINIKAILQLFIKNLWSKIIHRFLIFCSSHPSQICSPQSRVLYLFTTPLDQIKNLFLTHPSSLTQHYFMFCNTGFIFRLKSLLSIGVCLSIISIYILFTLSLSFLLSICLCLSLSICLSFNISINLSLSLSASLSISQLIYLSLYLPLFQYLN